LLETRDYENVLDFLSLIQDSNDNFQYNVLDSLRKVFGYEKMAFFLDKKPIDIPVTLNLESKLLDEYTSYFYKIDNFRDRQLYQKDIISVEDTMTIEEYEKSEYYNEFLKKYDLYYAISLPLKIGTNCIGAIGIHKPKEWGNFTTREKLILSKVSKHISSNLNRVIEFSELKFQEMMLANSIHHLPIGLMLFDGEFSLLNYNNTAYEYCSNIVSTSTTSGNPMANVSDLIASHLKNQTVRTSTNSQIEINIQSFHIKIHIIQVPAHLNKNSTKLYGVYIYPQSKQKTDPIKQAMDIYGLSKRETEIIDLLTKGYSNNDIANKLYLTINTVKSHLNNIYNKMDVNNRTAVLHKLSQIYHDESSSTKGNKRKHSLYA